MRKIVLSLTVSLDGFFEGPAREIDWHLVDEEVHAHFNEWIAATGGLLTGRVTHELMAQFWPTADADPATTKEMAEFAAIWRDMPKFVFSRTRTEIEWATTVLPEVDVDWVRALKAEPGGDLVLGGADLAESFRRHDLIDEYRLYINPILLGRGRPMFGPADGRTPLRLAETRVFGNGVVLLRYER